MNNYLETLVQGSGAALLLIPAVVGTARMLGRRKKRRPDGPSRRPELGTALGEIETLLDEINVTLEHSIAQHAPHSQSERAVAKAGDQINEITDSIQGIVDEVKELADPSHFVTGETSGASKGFRLPVPVVLREMAMMHGQRGRIFFKSGFNFDTSGQAYTLRVVGNKGSQRLTFASNTARADIVAAINQFSARTGVGALEDHTTTSGLVRLVSMRIGRNQFVGAKMVRGNRHRLLLNEFKHHPTDAQLDFGSGR